MNDEKWRQEQLKNWKDRQHRFFRRPTSKEDWDAVSARFIRIVASDPEIDIGIFCRLGPLFALPKPETEGGYAHHTGNRIIGR